MSDKLHSSTSYSVVGHDVNVNESTTYTTYGDFHRNTQKTRLYTDQLIKIL